jgi:hypothetical protein
MQKVQGQESALEETRNSKVMVHLLSFEMLIVLFLSETMPFIQTEFSQAILPQKRN